MQRVIDRIEKEYNIFMNGIKLVDEKRKREVEKNTPPKDNTIYIIDCRKAHTGTFDDAFHDNLNCEHKHDDARLFKNNSYKWKRGKNNGRV